MAVSGEVPRSFRLYVTHVDGEGHFLKISGQLDQQSSLMLESLFESARENLEKGIGAVPPGAIHEGVICAAKYKDGTYYRAKVINTTNLSTGLVGVHFIDFGNKDIISLSTIRFLDSYDPMFLQLRGQATDYYLSRVMNPSGRWEEPLLLKLQSLLCYSEYAVTLDVQTQTFPMISIQFKGQDLSNHLVSIRFGMAVPLVKQEVLLHQISEKQQPSWPSNFHSESPAYPEHVPFLLNQNFPSNPASAMRLQQNVAIPFNGNLPVAPSLISQRLLVNKASRNTVNLRAPVRQPQHATGPVAGLVSTPPPVSVPSNAVDKPTSPKKSITYKSKLLEVNSQYQVYVSYADEGPELFAVQLVPEAGKLQEMMDNINRRPHKSLTEPPMIGTVCLGRMSGDRIICRAIVMNLSGSQCKLFFVDFGDTEMVSYYDIFDIPEEFVKPNVYAMRFCLSGVKKLEKGLHLNQTFKQLVAGQILTLKVVSPEGPPLIQYGELYMDNKNVLDLLLANMKNKLQFKWLEMLPLGSKESVLVSYVDSCIKFYVQLSSMIDELNSVMDAVKVHCENSKPPGVLPVGAACCARFPDDGNWYRAHIKDVRGKKVVVVYVDYGNEQEVDVSDLRTITQNLIMLPAQALKCALKGFENKPVETKTSNQLEMLALEKTLMAHIVGVLSSDTMLVTLVDDTVSPPLDVARRMNQLSQPRSSHEAKPTTPVRKDAPETISSPEGSQPDDNRKKGFRREKSFKDEWRGPREGNEEFQQRGGSLRNRDNKEGFDRYGPGRHSEKFGGRPDRGERNDRNDRGGRDRGGPKPWENNNSGATAAQGAPLPTDDDWEESPASNQTTPPRNNRDNNWDRRKPRDQQERSSGRPNSKKDSGVGKRLRQAAEAASNDTQSVPRGSVQDRLKRERFNHQDEREERKNDDWGSRTGGGAGRDRPDRRDNRGENRGERRDNWGDRGQRRDFSNKGEFGGNRSESGGNRGEFGGNRSESGGNRGEYGSGRGGRAGRGGHDKRSNFTPRDRTERSERSFGSDDKHSEKSFRSQDSRGERSGRTPPKPRGHFTQVQYKEIPNPVPLDTAFAEPIVELGAQHEISVTWIISPESFFTQILSLQPKFLEMMHKIPELYKGVKPYNGDVPVGSSVLARYPSDGVLYRATVVAVQPFSKFIVRYVDFGNKQLVDVRDIWQLDQQLMELPKMAVHCSLIGVAPKDGEWKADTEIDLCFNAPRYQCVFQEYTQDPDQYRVSLWNNGVSVLDMLVEKGLAVMSEHQSEVTLKDEPIDMTIIIGQQIFCRVTHVKSFDEFYVQLDLEKARIVEETIANYDIAKLTPPSPELIVENTHCTIKHDGKVCRAILQDVSDANNIKAVLPDYGKEITTSVDNIMILPTELSVYYYQSLQASFNNYSAESKQLMSLDELKQQLTGNKFILYINDVDNITLVTTLYDCVTGQKVSIFEPDEGAYDEVVPLCMRAVFNYNFGLAYVSHAENLNEFYLQKASDGDRITELLEALYNFYEEGTPEALTVFESEGLCAAKSIDGNWYRATIVEIEDTQAKVHFTDYGNSETVAKESIKRLDPKFFEPCSLALVASLGLVALQDEALSKLIEWTTEKELQVTLSFGNDGWLANLHLDGVDLSMKLINEKLATPQIVPKEETKPEPPVQEPAVAAPDGCTRVYISHIDTPGHFWLQMLDKIEKIDEIQAELQANADSYPDVENREMGTLCVAKYLADEHWYRAEILDSDADITTVRFVDYGNTDVLDNQPGLIKQLPERLQEIERYAVKASVNAVPTGTGEWSEAASECFTQLVGDLSAAVDALIVLKDVTTYVDIYVHGRNTTDELVSGGHAARADQAECGALPEAFASHVNSPQEFWIQLESATPDLQAMEAAMVDAENFPSLESREEGVVCAAKYPEDGAWYRAQVIVDGSEGTEVLFMDYGNASIANELRTLPEELKVKPALSRKCALQKPRDVKSWSRKSEIKFNELAAEGATIFNVQFIASGDISIVELYLEGKSVTEELVGLCEEQQPTEKPTNVELAVQTCAKVCYVHSLDEFYVHLVETIPSIDKVTTKLIEGADFESILELKIGSICAAFWAEDEQWYRAKVLEYCENEYCVQFIDYGNKANCTEFRELPEELAAMEPLAKCCCLAGAPSDKLLEESGKNKLDEMACEDVTFQIEYLDSSKEPTPVKILLDGVDLISTFTNSSLTTQHIDTSGKMKNEDVSTTSAEKTNDPAMGDKVSIKDLKIEDLPVSSDSNEEFTTTSVQEVEKTPIERDNENSEIDENESEKYTAQAETVAKNPIEERNTVEDSQLITDDLEKEHFDDAEDLDELNSSQHDLNESIESTHTVIQNQSFESTENLSVEGVEEETPNMASNNTSTEIINDSNSTIKTPEREESKESINTDTGYTSCGDNNKSSEKDESAEHETSPKKALADNMQNKESEGSNNESITDESSPKKALIDNLNNVELEESENESTTLETSPIKALVDNKKDLKSEGSETESAPETPLKEVFDNTKDKESRKPKNIESTNISSEPSIDLKADVVEAE